MDMYVLQDNLEDTFYLLPRSVEDGELIVYKNVISCKYLWKQNELECGPMPNLMVALANIGGALCSTPQSLADADY